MYFDDSTKEYEKRQKEIEKERMEEKEKQRAFYSSSVDFCKICGSACSSIGCLKCS
jgi:hypothetical protein